MTHAPRDTPGDHLRHARVSRRALLQVSGTAVATAAFAALRAEERTTVPRPESR